MNNSLLSAGCRIAGAVRNSVLSQDVRIEAGARVEDSVILHGVLVRSGAVVVRSIVDEGIEIGAGARVGGDGDIALVGGHKGLPKGVVVPPGGRYPDSQDTAETS